MRKAIRNIVILICLFFSSCTELKRFHLIYELHSRGFEVSKEQVFDDDGIEPYESRLTNRVVTDDIVCKVIELEPDIQLLDLSFSGITDQSVKCIQKLPKLEELRIPETEVTIDFVKGLRKIPSLKRLSIYETSNLGDDSIDVILEYDNIEFLFIGGSAISTEKKRELYYYSLQNDGFSVKIGHGSIWNEI